MVSQASALRVGQALEIGFPVFTPRITIRSERKLTVEIVAGDDAGFSDTVDYEAVVVRDGLVMLSWRDHIGSTIVQVLDLPAREAYVAVTPPKGELIRLKGRIEPYVVEVAQRLLKEAVMSVSTIPIQEAITGRGELSDITDPSRRSFSSTKALNGRDLALMEQNWDSSADAVMDNPLRGVKCGWAAIRIRPRSI